MKKTIYVVAMEYWAGDGYYLEDVVLFTSKEKAEWFKKDREDAECSCMLFEEEVEIEIDFKIV